MPIHAAVRNGLCFFAASQAGALRPTASLAHLRSGDDDVSYAVLKEHLADAPGFHPGVMHGRTARRLAASLLEKAELPAKHWAHSLLQLAPGAHSLLQKPDDAAAGGEIKAPWEWGEPLARCPTAEEGHFPSEEEANLHEALKIFCRAGLGSLVEFYVDPRFQAAHDKFKDKSGWIDKAYMTYMGVRQDHDAVSAEEDLLVQSINHFSDYPVVVTNFGRRLPEAMTPERFPNMILMHARSTADAPVNNSFNFNKMTGMAFTKIRSGVVFDADQWVNKGVDYMLERAAEETTKEYPYPIMPVHWLSRDPDDQAHREYHDYAFNFRSASAPKRTLRWGHAHPTWTHHALPWLATWTSYALSPNEARAPKWLMQQLPLEDEDIMNVGLWAVNATKQWCKFDISFPDRFTDYLSQHDNGFKYEDSIYYPKGIAYMYFTAHAAKDPNESYGYLEKLWDTGDDKRKAMLYDGKWFGSGKALRDYDPSLKCIA